MKKCCICGNLFEGYGNNPAPIETRGECCDYCNAAIVIPYRIAETKRIQLQAAADALTFTPLSSRESAKLNALVGKLVEIEFVNGDTEVGTLHKDTDATYTQNSDANNTEIRGYYIDRKRGELHFKKSHVKKIRPTEAVKPSEADINALVGKSVLIKFESGTSAAGFLHQTLISAGDSKQYLVRYYVETPTRGIYFRTADVETIREH